MRCIRGRSQYSETSLRNIAAKTSQWNAIAKSHGETPRRDSTMKHHGGAHREALQQNVTAKYIGEALRRKAASKANRKMAPPCGREILPSGAAAREINKKRRAASPFFRIFGYHPLFASVSAVRARKRRDHSPHLQTVSSSETEDSLPRIPHRAVRQPFSPFPMRFCDPPHYSRMRSHTVPDPSLFSCSALYSPKPR